MTIKEALRNYLKDLEHNGLHWGRENLNYMTRGTPEFSSDYEMHSYINAIGSLITEEDAQ
jgi:hypothetical protein